MIVVALSAAGGKAPDWVQMIPFGEHDTDKGKVILDAAGAAAVLEYYSSRKTDPVVDYEHQTLKGVQAPAAGWIEELEDRGGDGIWAKVDWCKRARELLEAREYRYLSPVMLLDQTRRVVRLLGAGLTNFPALDGMVPVVAKRETGGGDAAKPKEEGITMKNILIALGLKENAAESEAVTAIDALKEAAGRMIPVACKGLLTALGLPETATESEAVGTVTAMKSGSDNLTALTAQVKDLREKLAARDADELALAALKGGKISPGQLDWAKKYAAEDPEGFKVFAAKAPVVAQPGEGGKPPADNPQDGEPTAAELVACSQLGIPVETFKKHNKRAA